MKHPHLTALKLSNVVRNPISYQTARLIVARPARQLSTQWTLAALRSGYVDSAAKAERVRHHATTAGKERGKIITAAREGYSHAAPISNPTRTRRPAKPRYTLAEVNAYTEAKRANFATRKAFGFWQQANRDQFQHSAETQANTGQVLRAKAQAACSDGGQIWVNHPTQGRQTTNRATGVQMALALTYRAALLTAAEDAHTDHEGNATYLRNEIQDLYAAEQAGNDEQITEAKRALLSAYLEAKPQHEYVSSEIARSYYQLGYLGLVGAKAQGRSATGVQTTGRTATHKQEATRAGFETTKAHGTTYQHDAEKDGTPATKAKAVLKAGRMLIKEKATPDTRRHTRNAQNRPAASPDTYRKPEELQTLFRAKKENDATQYEDLNQFKKRIAHAMLKQFGLTPDKDNEGLLTDESKTTHQLSATGDNHQRRAAKCIYSLTLPQWDAEGNQTGERELKAYLHKDGYTATVYEYTKGNADENTDELLHRVYTDKQGEEVPGSKRATARMLAPTDAPHLTGRDIQTVAIICTNYKTAEAWRAHFAAHVPVSLVREITTAHFKVAVSKPTYSEAWTEEGNSDEYRTASAGAYFSATVKVSELHTFTQLKPKAHRPKTVRVSRRIYDAAQQNGLKVSQLPARIKRAIARLFQGLDEMASTWRQDTTATNVFSRYRTEKNRRAHRTNTARLASILKAIAAKGARDAKRAASATSRADAESAGYTDNGAKTRRRRGVKAVGAVLPECLTVRGKKQTVLDTTHPAYKDIEACVSAYTSAVIEMPALNRVLNMIATARESATA